MEKFDYSKEQLENINCNLCGRDDFFVLARESKNNLPVRTVFCKHCGLIYLNPRLSKSGYSNYYKYFYRQDRKEIKGKEAGADLAGNFGSARRLGQGLAKILRQFLKPGLTIDIGSSTGGLLFGLREAIPGLEVLGIEPSVAESNYANERGVKTVDALFEDFDRGSVKETSNVFCVQSLNHLLDPARFIKWAYDILKPEGHLILMVKNFRHQCRRAGAVKPAVQIDHPYMFVPETLRAMIEAVGFEVVYLDNDEHKSWKELTAQKQMGLPIHHFRIVGRKPQSAARIKDPANPSLARQLKRQFLPLALKTYYLAVYSRRLEPLRRILRKLKLSQ